MSHLSYLTHLMHALAQWRIWRMRWRIWHECQGCERQWCERRRTERTLQQHSWSHVQNECLLYCVAWGCIDAFDACTGAFGTSVRVTRGSGARGGGQRELCNNTHGATLRLSVWYTVCHDAYSHNVHALAQRDQEGECKGEGMGGGETLGTIPGLLRFCNGCVMEGKKMQTTSLQFDACTGAFDTFDAFDKCWRTHAIKPTWNY